MSKEMFVELANGFCRLANLAEPERLMAGHPIQMDGVDFYLGYDEEAEPDHVVVYCDFGPPPQDRLLKTYEVLLEFNLAMYGSHSPAFMLSPSKAVTLGYHYRLGEVDPEQLIHLMNSLVDQAKQWRLHYFLDAA